MNNGILETKKIITRKILGGENFTDKLVAYCLDEFKKKTSIDIKNNDKALRKLRIHCEKAKKRLSSASKVSIDIKDLIDGKDFNIVLTREKFENICKDLFKLIISNIKNFFSNYPIDEIILIGGSSRIPIIPKIIEMFYPKAKINIGINP